MTTDGSLKRAFTLDWRRPDDEAVSCWADEEFTTEQGAYGVALVLVEEVTSWTVVERSRKGTGFDYWLGGEPLFQKAARLEVSGIRRGGRQEVHKRMRRKLHQVRNTGSSLPGIVIVVEFSRPHSEVERR